MRLTAARIGAIAASGVGTVEVSRAARVAVVSTGSELVAPGASCVVAGSPSRNSVLLAGLAEEAGADVVLRTIVDDEGDGPRRAIAAAEAAGADSRRLLRGVSAGAYEVVKNTLGDLMRFDRVRMQPENRRASGAPPPAPCCSGSRQSRERRGVVRAVRASGTAGTGGRRRPRARAGAGGARRGVAGATGRTQYVPVSLDRSDPQTLAGDPDPARHAGPRSGRGTGRDPLARRRPRPRCPRDGRPLW